MQDTLHRTVSATFHRSLVALLLQIIADEFGQAPVILDNQNALVILHNVDLIWVNWSQNLNPANMVTA
jgi:hypothetical protein